MMTCPFGRTARATVVVIGASAAAVVLFEILLAGTSLFNHENLRLPRFVDSVLRWLVVTPSRPGT